MLFNEIEKILMIFIMAIITKKMEYGYQDFLDLVTASSGTFFIIRE